MPSISVRVQNGKVYQSLSKLGDALPGLINDDLEAVLDEARDEMAQPGSPIAYPVRWDSEKQRRAYFATDGFGAGIPYSRTGGYGAGYVVEKTGYQTRRQFTLYNRQPQAKYIGGDAGGGRQSRIHRGRWPLIFDVVRRHAGKLLAATQAAVHHAFRAAGIGL